MRVLIVCESQLGSTHHVAEAVAGGLRLSAGTSVRVEPVESVSGEDLAVADLVVVGGPTHAGSLPSVGTRAAPRALARVGQPAGGGRSGGAVIDLVAEAELPTVGPELRHWFHELPAGPGRVAAAFDTRLAGERGAAGVIARRLGRLGYRVLAAEGFVVDGASAPVGHGELVRARHWGADLAHQVSSAIPR